MPALESRLIEENTTLWRIPHAGLDNPNPVVSRVQNAQLLRIMGVCSLTSLPQIEEMLKVIGNHTDLVRAPGKKPRTRPVNTMGERLFEGIGLRDAVCVYQEIQERHSTIQFASEVMSGDDLSLIAPFLGLAWIGSRTQQQETCRDIGRSAEAAKLPIMVKNPLVADMELMLGMLENTILGADSSVPLLLCLRGIAPSTPEYKAAWRNVPNLDWIAPIHQEFPDLPIIIDPSHMLKKSDLNAKNVVNIVKQGVDQGANGYILELNTPDHPSITDPGTNAEETLDLLVRSHLA